MPLGYHSAVDQQPLPAMYFEPTVNREYLYPAAEPECGAVGHGTVQNRGVQNVPSMSTVGVQYTVDQTGSRVPTGAVPAGSGVPFIYQPSSSAYTLAYEPQPLAGTALPTVAGGRGVVHGQPVMVSGSSCPLCGRQDYHVHSDSVAVNSTSDVVSGATPAAAVASSGTIPVAVTPEQSTFWARCKQSNFNNSLRLFLITRQLKVTESSDLVRSFHSNCSLQCNFDVKRS